MRFPNISKTTGWCIIPFILLVFAILFRNRYIWMYGFEPTWNTATQIALAGAFLTQVAYIPSGSQAALTFGGKKISCVWEDGISPLPNFFHITIKSFSFSVLWGLLPLRQDNYEYEHLDHHINMDNRRVTRSYQANVTAGQMVWISFFKWVFIGWMELPVHLRVSAFGFRIMLAGIFSSLFTSGIPVHLLNRL